MSLGLPKSFDLELFQEDSTLQPPGDTRARDKAQETKSLRSIDIKVHRPDSLRPSVGRSIESKAFAWLSVHKFTSVRGIGVRKFTSVHGIGVHKFTSVNRIGSWL